MLGGGGDKGDQIEANQHLYYDQPKLSIGKKANSNPLLQSDFSPNQKQQNKTTLFYSNSLAS